MERLYLSMENWDLSDPGEELESELVKELGLELVLASGLALVRESETELE